MKTKNKWLLIAAAVAVFAVTQSGTVKAGPNDHELPAEDDLFWQVTSSMSRPDDTAACQAAIDAIPTADLLAYAIANPHGDGGPQGGSEAEQTAGIRQGFSQMCTMIAQMPTEMESSMAAEGASSNLFNMSDWHHASSLYFEKSGKGRISFTNTLDFLSYRFMRFMNNFGSMVVMNDGYVSLNAAMLDDIKNYGAQITMIGLDLGNQIPDIYVDGKLATSNDINGITYDAVAGTLTFNASHFSAYKAVAHGTKVKAMKMGKLTKKSKSIKYNSRKSTFKVVFSGKNLKPASGQTKQCTLGFETASRVSVNKKGTQVTCVFTMSYFSDKGTFPLTYAITGKGEVSKANAVRIR